MQNRRTSRPRSNRGPGPQGNTLPAQAQGTRQQAVPRLPHERDESADSQPAGEASGRRMGAMAHRDLQRGLEDTDKGPVMDAAYDRLRDGGATGR
jgi:hypothetical protein